MTAVLASDVIVRTSTGEAVMFWVLSALALLGAVGVVLAVNAVYSAMFLAMTMIILAVFYMAQDALFLGVVQVVVYTGAVMMLFLFVLMLIGVDSAESLKETLRGRRVAAVLTGVGFGVLLISTIGQVATRGFAGLTVANANGNVEGLAALIFPLPVGVRVDQCAVDYRRRRGDGASAPGAFRAPQDPARTLPGTLPSRRAPPPRCPTRVSTRATTRSTLPPCSPTVPIPNCRSPDAAHPRADGLQTPSPGAVSGSLEGGAS